MNQKRNLFSLASALGKTGIPSEAASPEPETEKAFTPRLALIMRSGRYVSYPYACIGLIEQPSTSLVVLHCSCNLVESIQIRGQNLRSLAEELTAQSIPEIKETAHPTAEQAGCAVWEIVIKPVDSGDEA